MTRCELILHIVQRARAHGFHFRRWYQNNIDPEWTSLDHALRTLEHGHRYYALLFSHEFASHFWKKGTQITFVLPSREYTRLDRNGKIVTIQRKSFTRRTSRSTSSNLWQYHLEQMALWEEPLRYIRRFILTDEEIEEAGGDAAPAPPPRKRPGLTRRRVDWC
ncbi:MAG TPA: hypothetical protein VME18_00150 [Acidobacteriaceae bacterium]|nr:hypothetical protein [Acidobacteriaceae bacterium]